MSAKPKRTRTDVRPFGYYDQHFRHWLKPYLPDWHYPETGVEIEPLDIVPAHTERPEDSLVYFVLRRAPGDNASFHTHVPADSWSLCNSLLDEHGRNADNPIELTHTQLRVRLLCLLLDRPESIFEKDEALDVKTLTLLLSTDEIVLPEIQTLISSRLVHTLQRALAGILLIKKKRKRKQELCQQVCDLLDTERSHYSKATATALMLDFLWQAAVLYTETDCRASLEHIGSLLELADRGYIPALLYAIRRTNAILRQGQKRHSGWGSTPAVTALRQRMKRQLELACERIKIINPLRLQEFEALVALQDDDIVDLGIYTQEGASFRLEQLHQGELDAGDVQPLLKALMFYGYNFPELPEAAITSGVASFAREVGDVRGPFVLAANIANCAVSVGNKDIIEMLLDELDAHCRKLPRPLAFNEITFLFSPHNVSGEQGVHVGGHWQPGCLPGKHERTYDGPLLPYPGHYPWLPARLTALHLEASELNNSEFGYGNFIILALLFERPAWKYIQPIFFGNPKYHFSMSAQTMNALVAFFELAAESGGPLLGSKLRRFLVMAINDRFEPGPFKLEPLLEEIRACQPPGSPIYLFCRFVKAVCETSRRYLSPTYNLPELGRRHQIIAPLIEVAEAGYLPAIDVIDDMLDEQTGILQPGTLPKKELEQLYNNLSLVLVMKALIQLQLHFPEQAKVDCQVDRLVDRTPKKTARSRAKSKASTRAEREDMFGRLLTLEAIDEMLPRVGNCKPSTRTRGHVRPRSGSDVQYEGAVLEFCDPGCNLLVSALQNAFRRATTISAPENLLACALYMLFFSEPEFDIYRKIFFDPDADDCMDSNPGAMESTLCLSVDNPLLIPAIFHSMQLVINGRYDGYASFSELDQHITAFRKQRDNPGAAFCTLFFTFLRSVMEAAYLWRNQDSPDPEGMLEPVIKVAEAGYFPAVKLIEQLIAPDHGLFVGCGSIKRARNKIKARLNKIPQSVAVFEVEPPCRKKASESSQSTVGTGDRQNLRRILDNDNKGNNLLPKDKQWLQQKHDVMHLLVQPGESCQVNWLIHGCKARDIQLASLQHYLVDHLNEGNLRKGKEIVQEMLKKDEAQGLLRAHICDRPMLGAGIVLASCRYEGNLDFRNYYRQMREIICRDQWVLILAEACLQFGQHLKYKGAMPTWFQYISCFLAREVTVNGDCIFPGSVEQDRLLFLLTDDDGRCACFKHWLRECQTGTMTGISKKMKSALLRVNDRLVSGDFVWPPADTAAAVIPPPVTAITTGGRKKHGRRKAGSQDFAACATISGQPMLVATVPDWQFNDRLAAQQKADELLHDTKENRDLAVQCPICMMAFCWNKYAPKSMPCCSTNLCSTCIGRMFEGGKQDANCWYCRSRVQKSIVEQTAVNRVLMGAIEILDDLHMLPGNNAASR
ncbi:hypothetical protein ACWJJH_02940 [Endozoicomonadaceae bacterium StTr2]